MIPITIDVYQDVQKLDTFRKRGFSRIQKRGLQDALLGWQRKILPRHFKTTAAGRYGLKPNPKTHRPLVLTGTLRSRVLNRVSRSDLRGTSKSMRIRLRYGRPAEFPSEKDLQKGIFALMEEKDISYTAARRAVYRNAGFSRAARKTIDRGLTATAPDDIRLMRNMLRRSIVGQLNASGPRRRT